MRNPPLAIVASALLATGGSTPPRASLRDGNVLELEGGYLAVPTPEGDRPSRDGGGSRSRLVGKKDDYLPGQIFLSETGYDTGPDGVDGITSHYRGGIHFDRERKRVVIDIRFADGTPTRQNGTYRYVDPRRGRRVRGSPCQRAPVTTAAVTGNGRGAGRHRRAADDPRPG